MSRSGLLLLLLFLASSVAQPQDEDFRVYTDHPRLLLTRQRLRLLRRERERRSMRWDQFETLMSGKARMPEPGFSAALYAQITGQRDPCRQAVTVALAPSTDLRQQALVFDWCQAQLTEPESRDLAARLERGLRQSQGARDIPAVRSRVLAAVALAERAPDLAERELTTVVTAWWRNGLVPALRQGRAAIPREHTYALLELLHIIRDNLNIDLRDAFPRFFKQLPAYHLLSHYPAPYPAAENEYRIPIFHGSGEPDLDQAALSRAAELAMVAYDTNAPENQYVQGWLMQDRFLMRGALGALYEFLWANPYQPGLSYHHLPLLFHDAFLGRLFARSSWEEDASWFGYFDGEAQRFENGRVKVLRGPGGADPMQIGEVLVFAARQPLRFRLNGQDASRGFFIGLKPRTAYDVEIDHEEMREASTDPGGILSLELAPNTTAAIRLKQVIQ